MKNNKEKYASPEIKVIEFKPKDIITDSMVLPEETFESN